MSGARDSYDPARWRRACWDEPGTIYFWSGQRRGAYEVFSNFAATPFRMPAWMPELGDVDFATGEHAFQAAKASTVAEHERIRQALTPLAAKRIGRAIALPAGWDQRRHHVMLAVVRAKFARGELREVLLGTRSALLAEDSPHDPVWGCRDRNRGYTGQNLLGRALMRVRDELAADADHADRTLRITDVSRSDRPQGVRIAPAWNARPHLRLVHGERGGVER
jgi:hypothetical protein